MKFATASGRSVSSLCFAVFALVGTPVLSAAPGQLKWHVPVPVVGGPVLGTNGLVYAVSQQGQVYARDAATGQTQWETNVGGYHYGTILIGPNHHVYVQTTSGLHTLEGETGREIGHFDEPLGYFALGADGTFFGSTYESMLALDPVTGRRRWAYLGQLFGTPALSPNGLIFTLASLGRVLALDTATGMRVWEFQERTANLSSLLVAREGTVIVHGSFDLTNHWEERVLALDGATGEQLWQFTLPGQLSGIIVADDGSLCIGSYGGTIYVLDPLTGYSRREIDLGFSAFGNMTLAADGTLYFSGNTPAGGHQLYALNFVTGETNWVFSPTNYGISGLNIGADGTLYFQYYSSDGGLTAVHGSSPLANTAWPKGLQNPQNTSFWNLTGPPIITRQPRSHWAASGASTAFHFHSPIMRPLHVQWRLNGQPIPGATSETLRIDPVRFSDAGSYSVMVSNQFGTVVSEQATLSVGYALALTTLGPGTVQRVPDLAVYPTNSPVQLIAIAATNRNFLGWSGDATGAAETITLTLDRNYAITAEFEYFFGDLKWVLPVDISALSHDGTLAYGRTLYRYLAVDTRTRHIVWEVESSGENYSPPVVGPEGNVYYTSYGGQLVALNGRTGERKWAFGIGVCTSVPAAVGADGTVYFGGAKLFAIDPATGLERWSVSGFGGHLVIGPAGAVYAHGTNGLLAAFDGHTGQKLSDFPNLSLPIFGPDGSLHFEASLIGPDGTLYRVTPEGAWHAFDPQTGAEKWSVPFSGPGAVTADGTLLLATLDRLVGINSANGNVLWESDTNSYPGATALNFGPDGTIYLGRYVFHGTSPLAVGGWPTHAQNPQNTAASTVDGAPAVTRPPASHWAADNGATTFRFYSPVLRPVHIQWQFNGRDIPGATNETLTIQGVQFQHAGDYTVVLSNQFGVITSAPALLSVGYGIDVALEGLGAVQRTPDLAVYPTNTVVQLLATPQNPRNFLGWTGDVTSQSDTVEITLTRNHRLTANFQFLPGDKKWAFPTRAYWLDSTPALGGDGTLYFTGGGILYAVDSATRQKKWEFLPADGSPALGLDGTVYVGSGFSKFYALDGATGALKWEFLHDVHDRLQPSPALGIDKTVYIAGQHLYALDGKTGALRWTYPGAAGPPAIGADGTVYCVGSSGNIFALNGVTGTRQWEFGASNSLTGSPALGADGAVYIGAWYGKVYALHPVTGRPIWQFATDAYLLYSPVVGPDGTVYIGSIYGELYALDGFSGGHKWTFEAPGSANPPVVAADGTVYFVSSHGTLYALDASTGESKWESLLTENWGGQAAPTLAPDGTLYVGAVGATEYTGGPLVAVHTSSRLANSSWPKFRGQLDNRARAHSRPLLDPTRSKPTLSGFELILHTEPGDTVQLQSSSNLQTWTPLATLTNTQPPIQFTDTNAPATHRFYRAHSP